MKQLAWLTYTIILRHQSMLVKSFSIVSFLQLLTMEFLHRLSHWAFTIDPRVHTNELNLWALWYLSSFITFLCDAFFLRFHNTPALEVWQNWKASGTMKSFHFTWLYAKIVLVAYMYKCNASIIFITWWLALNND